MNGYQPAALNWEWDIRPNPPDINQGGHGIGSPIGPPSPVTMNGFWFEVASGTPHGIVPMWVHSWDQMDTTGDGFPDSTFQVNVWDLVVSAPIPEPASAALLLGTTSLIVLIRRRFIA